MYEDFQTSKGTYVYAIKTSKSRALLMKPAIEKFDVGWLSSRQWRWDIKSYVEATQNLKALVDNTQTTNDVVIKGFFTKAFIA